MVGNGVCDTIFDGNALVPFAHGMGLISEDIYKVCWCFDQNLAMKFHFALIFSDGLVILEHVLRILCIFPIILKHHMSFEIDPECSFN